MTYIHITYLWKYVRKTNLSTNMRKILKFKFSLLDGSKTKKTTFFKN